MNALTDRMPTLIPVVRKMTASRFLRIALRILLWLVVLVFAVRTIVTLVMERRLTSMVGQLSGKYGSMMPASLAPPPVPAADNQAALFRAAGEALALDDADQKLIGSVASGEAKVADHADALRRVLESNRLVIDLATEASKRQGSNWEIDYKRGVEAKLPDLVKALQVGRLVASRSLLALHDGSPKEAIDALEPATDLAGSLSREPMLIVQLMQIAVDRINHGVMRQILMRSRGLDEEDLSRLLRMLPAPAPVSGMRGAFLGEMKMGYKSGLDLLEGGSPLLLGEDVNVGKLSFNVGPLTRWAKRPELLRELRGVVESYSQLIEELDKPRFERARFFTNDVDRAPLGKGIWFEIAVPNLMDAVLRADLNDTSTEIARSAFAVEAYAKAHSGYPESLDALVPSYLERVPLDAFTGRPLEYRREGSGFVLRSGGDDQKFHVAFPSEYDKLVVWRVTH